MHVFVVPLISSQSNNGTGPRRDAAALHDASTASSASDCSPYKYDTSTATTKIT